MTRSKVTEHIDPSIFAREPVDCCVCREHEATHQVAINVDKGLEYSKSQSLYRVSYVVCGDCAKDIVEVKLDAKLLRRGRSS